MASNKKRKQRGKVEASSPILSRVQKEGVGVPWSKSKKKRMRLLQGSGGSGDGKTVASYPSFCEDVVASTDETVKSPRPRNQREEKASGKNDNDNTMRGAATETGQEIVHTRPISALQQSYASRLSGSRFRELNEELYTSTSQSAFQRFSARPNLFEQYHRGFRTQVQQWPVNPVDVVFEWLVNLQKRTKTKKKLWEDHDGPMVVADFGCGDAKLAIRLTSILHSSEKSGTGTPSERAPPFMVHSFDLVSNGNPLITACDIGQHVPLPDNSVHVGIFCLALMGTNMADFIREAHRVLLDDGILKIVEVRSRFEFMPEDDQRSTTEQTNGGSNKRTEKHPQPRRVVGANQQQRSDGVTLFCEFMQRLGFKCTNTDTLNKMFVLLEFEKDGTIVPSTDATFTAKPCIYKRR